MEINREQGDEVSVLNLQMLGMGVEMGRVIQMGVD